MARLTFLLPAAKKLIVKSDTKFGFKSNKVICTESNQCKYQFTITEDTWEHWCNNLPSYAASIGFKRKIKPEVEREWLTKNKSNMLLSGRKRTEALLLHVFKKETEMRRVEAHATDIVADITGNQNPIFNRDYKVEMI